MKRSLIILAVLLAVLGYVGSVWAAGTATATAERINIANRVQRTVLTISWTDDTNGTTLAVNPATYGIKGWYLVQAETDPGSTAPTDNYDITLVTASGYDYALGLLANRDTINTERVSIADSTVSYPVVIETFTFTLSGNAVNNATGMCKLIFSEN